VEHLDVLVVGAGLSGIGAGHHLQTACPWADYAIFEARDAIGGTWDLFRYPGVRSDSDMFTLGYPFRPWDSDVTIADGDSIRDYIVDTAREEGIDSRIRFGHRVLSADWSTEESRWYVTAEKVHSGEVIELTCGFYFACSGYYRYDHGHQPDFPGIEEFGGRVVHPQAWPTDLDYEGKEVVVIGSGATAVTLIPAMAETAGHVTMLQRSPTYVASVPQSSPLAPVIKKVVPKRWAGDAIRWTHALGTQGMYRFCQAFPDVAKRILTRGVASQLPPGYDVEKHFSPTYNPWDQRLCAVPDGDLFRAIRNGDASVVTDHIDTFTAGGIRLRSGEELKADIFVSATGLEVLFIGGIDLRVDGEEVDFASRFVYKGMMLEGVPNLAVAFGYTNASWTLKCDLTCGHVTRILNTMRERDKPQCTPINDAPSMASEPMLGLSSGYVTRAADRMPRQGSEDPWRVHQSYLKDYRALKRAAVDDGVLQLTKPARTDRPHGEHSTAAAV
jgi:cation diffusion facilitator CzcD-associated flavoprotein CzcO